jgi:hypothetical protein
VNKKVITDFEKKMTTLDGEFKKHIIQKVLISFNGADEQLASMGYFDRVLDMKDLIKN